VDQGLTVEILDDGRGRRRAGRFGSWSGRRRRVAAFAAGVALLGGAFVAVRVLPRDPWPTVDVVRVHPSSDAPDLWEAGWDGRPATSVALAVTAVVRQVPTPGATPAPVRVLGLAGPGISHNDTPPVELPAGGREVSVPMRAAVDCAEVPEGVPGDAYGLRVERGTRSGRRQGVVPAGAAGQAWSRAAELACATWAARRALTVTDLTMQVHRTLPRLTLTLTVANAGAKEATLDRLPADFRPVQVEGPLPLRIPPHRSVTARVTAEITSCDTIGSPALREGGGAVLTTAVGLAAVAGRVRAAPPAPDPADAGLGEGTMPTGVVLGEVPGNLLALGLDQVCGGLSPPVLLVPSGGVRFDPATRDLAVDVVLDVPPGRVRSLTLAVTWPFAARSTLVPRWTTAPPVLVPDRTGQARTTLHFRAAGPGPDCPRQPVDAPVLAVTLHVPAAGGERVLPHSAVVDLAGDPVGRAWMCAPAR
jgi:hypothetical protein